MNHHRDCGTDDDFFSSDPAGWDRASYSAHPIDSIEPLPEVSNPYRAAALFHLELMYSVDRFLEDAEDARLAITAISLVLGWPSVRGLSISNIAAQLGVSAANITRSMTKFREMSGLVAGGIQFIRPGAGYGRRRYSCRDLGNTN